MNRSRSRRWVGVCVGLCATMGAAGTASAAALTFFNNLAGFNAAAGNPPIAIDFDAIAKGTNIGGQSIAGVTFTATGSPLFVVQADETNTEAATYTSGGVVDASTNVLPATSGANILSPGGTALRAGPDADVESDGFEIVFTNPVSAFGFDHLSQSVDGFSFSGIQIFSPSDVPLLSTTIPISNLGGGGAPAGADFWGVVFDAGELIKRIVFTEDDADALFPDSNVGYDTFRFAVRTPNGVIPTPAALPAGLALLAAIALRRRR